jgi:hypothetical protein
MRGEKEGKGVKGDASEGQSKDQDEYNGSMDNYSFN